ncbi:hypothetical protein [Methylobacterium sp. AMS5]|uniref:hypothetical protein n=1 Tax=Methylobacterium sp. AMS5 TaxID=925818 RepID=UPI00074F99E5|nr:hypothetical protein [Methylobacterium sp. AMS5]AMB48323.1 hypothetical protein Y590_25480 [Methylobacterium sp. AMS5]
MTKALLTADDFVSAPIEEGDAGVILKEDGTFKVFSTAKLGADGLTEAQQKQGTLLMALAVALKNPTIMETLITMSRDPRVVGENPVDLGRTN